MKRSSVKKMSVMSGLLLFFLPFALNVNAKEYKKPGLLIISHGSSSGETNNKVEAMVEEMRKENNDKNYFHAIENAFLEVGAPTVKTGVERLQKAGCDMIVAVPFFTSQDGHTQEDIPVVLGLSSDPEILAELKEEGIELASPKLPVVITKTLNETKLLKNFAKSEVEAMSLKGKEEALVVVSLEKNDYKDIVIPKIANAAKYAANAKGIKNYKDTYSWQDESFWTNVMPDVKDFSKKSKRVFVVSLYTTRSAQSLYDNALKAAKQKGINTEEGFGKAKIIYSQNSLIDYPQTPKIVLEFAKKSL